MTYNEEAAAATDAVEATLFATGPQASGKTLLLDLLGQTLGALGIATTADHRHHWLKVELDATNLAVIGKRLSDAKEAEAVEAATPAWGKAASSGEDADWRRVRAVELAQPFSTDAEELVQNAQQVMAFLNGEKEEQPKAAPGPNEALSDVVDKLMAEDRARREQIGVVDPASPDGDVTALFIGVPNTGWEPRNSVKVFLSDVHVEVRRARQKFPGDDATLAALTEEVGELAKAMLGESQHAIYKEAVQVAAMAVRCALDGDATLGAYREQHAVTGGPARGVRPAVTVYPDGPRFE